VVHAPAVNAFEVHTDVATFKRRIRSKVIVSGWILIVVMRAEKKWINGRPMQTEWNRLKNDVVRHGSSVRARHGV